MEVLKDKAGCVVLVVFWAWSIMFFLSNCIDLICDRSSVLNQILDCKSEMAIVSGIQESASFNSDWLTLTVTSHHGKRYYAPFDPQKSGCLINIYDTIFYRKMALLSGAISITGVKDQECDFSNNNFGILISGVLVLFLSYIMLILNKPIS